MSLSGRVFGPSGRCLVIVFCGVMWIGSSGMSHTAGSSRARMDRGAPSPRAFMGMAYDEASRNVVLFGGSDGTNRLGDTWTWNGSSWTEEHPETSPSPRASMAMAYDAARAEIVLFGGCCDQNGGLLNETWTWDGTTWKQEKPATSPSPRADLGMAFHADTGRIVIFGGEGGALTPTWTWDGANWTQEDPAYSPLWVSGPGITEYRGQVVMFGGETICLEDICYEHKTSIWDGSNWGLRRQQVRPSRRSFVGMALESALQEVVLFGGTHSGDSLHDTWTWDGTQWTRQTPSTNPPRRLGMGMAYDAASQEVVLFGGQYYDGNYEVRGDTWTWNGSVWSPIG